MKNKIVVSVIIVHYKVKKELFLCLKSLYENNPKMLFEIIVVDNDEEKTIEKYLFKKFPKVKYIKSKNNIGYGAGNNLGVKQAKGKYLFFLNPDTQVKQDCIDLLVDFIQIRKNVGIVSPLLLDPNGKSHHPQGAEILTPLRAIFALSFLNKLFPNNSIARSYFLLDWNKKDIKDVDVVPGTAFVIRKNIFEKIGGFDEQFFLYFEEHDICLRVQKIGYKIFINPKAQIIHLGGKSTKKSLDRTTKEFRNSRFLYFKKYFGLTKALMVEMLLK